MAPQSHIVVTLRLPREQLEGFDFSECKPPVAKRPRKRPAKPRARALAEDEDDDTPAKKLSSAEPRAASTGSGIISGGGSDPILGNLPRSVKAAPVANTSGLDLDKTPCRKWTRRPIQWKSFTGFTYNVTAWCSDYSAQELAERARRDAELEESGERERGRGSKRAATPKAAKPKARKPKTEPAEGAPLPRGDPEDAEQEPASELASDLASEPPSEAASLAPAAASELNSEIA